MSVGEMVAGVCFESLLDALLLLPLGTGVYSEPFFLESFLLDARLLPNHLDARLLRLNHPSSA